MPWTINDYPPSWKNMDETVRRKAIDIANAMLAEGYDEDNAIPIATAKAKEWAEYATPKEKDELKHKDISKKRPSSDQKIYTEANVEVKYREDEKKWEVFSEGANKPHKLYDTKKEALEQAQKTASYRDSGVISYTKEGKKEK